MFTIKLTNKITGYNKIFKHDTFEKILIVILQHIYMIDSELTIEIRVR